MMRTLHNIADAPGCWGEWLRLLDAESQDAVVQLAVQLLPELVRGASHTRYDALGDEAAISTALRCAVRFYIRVGAIKGPLPDELLEPKRG